VRDIDQDLIDEENQRKADRRREQARSSFIARDPYYPPLWAADEFDNVSDPEV